MALIGWFKLIRIQSAAFGVITPIVAYMLAGGYMISWSTLLFGLLGWISHALGMADNALTDYWYDINDPNKTDFPLVSGAISRSDAEFFVKILLVLLIGYGAAISNSRLDGLIVLMAGMTAMLIYNRYNKGYYWKPIPLAVAISFVPLFTFMATGSNLTSFFLLVVAMVFVYTVYMIGVSGELKDLEREREKSFLKALGARFDGGRFYASRKVRIYAYTVQAVHVCLGWIIAWIAGTLIIACVSTVLIFSFVIASLKDGEWQREIRWRDMVLVEFFSHILHIGVVWPLLGLYETLFVIIFPIGYIVMMNKMLWGKTKIQPRI